MAQILEGDETPQEQARRIRREIAARQGGGQAFTGQTTLAPTNPEYAYRDPGMFGAPGYSYQVGDDFSGPGPEPPRDSPEWQDWKKHAAAWRNFIGGRQQYVNQMIGAGYNPEDLGITPRKEEGRAGYLRLTQPGVIDQLRSQSAQYMRGTDAEVDPTTGLYVTGQGPTQRYYDQRGMAVNAQGRPTGGFYGQQNTRAQFGSQAVPRNVANYATPNRMPRPSTTPQPTPSLPRPPESQLAANYGGWGGSLAPGSRNRRPRRTYQPNTYGF